MSNQMRTKLIVLADKLDVQGHTEEADLVDNIIQHLAAEEPPVAQPMTPVSPEAAEKVTDREKVQVIKDQYDLLGAVSLLHKRFEKEISSEHYKYLGDDIIENAKQKFNQLINILEQAKMKQSDMVGKEI